MGLQRIATGSDESEVSFSTIFGTVQWNMPRVAIRAVSDQREGFVEPFRQDYAISTDAGLAEPDEVVAQLHGAQNVMHGATPQVAAGGA